MTVAEELQLLADILAILVLALSIALLLAFRFHLLNGIVVAHKLVQLNEVPDDILVALEPRVPQSFCG